MTFPFATIALPEKPAVASLSPCRKSRFTNPGLPVAENTANPGVDFRAIFGGGRKDHVAAGLTYTVQFSADLAFWFTNTTTPTPHAGDDTANPGAIEAVSVPYPMLISTPNGEKEPKFFRVAVSSN